MRKLVLVVFAVVFSASAVQAGEAAAPDAGRQGRQGGRARGGPGGGMMPFGMMGRSESGTDLFDAARRSVTVPDDKQAAMENLAIEYAVAESEALAEVRKRLNKEYLVRILALLPEEEKPKYEKVIAAMTEQDETVAAARKELREVLDKVKVSQGADKVKPADAGQRFFQPRRGEVATRKLDVLRTCFVLSEDQRREIETIHDANRNGEREKIRARMGDQGAGGGRPDPAAMRQMAPVFRQIRTETDEADAKAVVNLLTDAQKKDFATATAAVDGYSKKVADAEAACRKKVVEAVGAEKANALLGVSPDAAAAPKPAPAGTTF
jgi:hypothetical protein